MIIAFLLLASGVWGLVWLVEWFMPIWDKISETRRSLICRVGGALFAGFLITSPASWIIRIGPGPDRSVNYTLFNNDGPLSGAASAVQKMPGAMFGCWDDMTWLGFRGAPNPVGSISGGIRTGSWALGMDDSRAVIIHYGRNAWLLMPLPCVIFTLSLISYALGTVYLPRWINFKLVLGAGFLILLASTVVIIVSRVEYDAAYATVCFGGILAMCAVFYSAMEAKS